MPGPLLAGVDEYGRLRPENLALACASKFQEFTRSRFGTSFGAQRLEITFLSILTPTVNEELNLEDCLASVCGWAKEVIVLDSLSTDKTLECGQALTSRHAGEALGSEIRFSSSRPPSFWEAEGNTSDRVFSV